MPNMKPEGVPFSDRVKYARTGLLLAILLGGALLTWWTVAQTDHNMRASQLQQAWFAAQAVNVQSVQTLTGTEADLGNPVYLRLKEQLATTRQANPQWTSLYLVGHRPDLPPKEQPVSLLEKRGGGTDGSATWWTASRPARKATPRRDKPTRWRRTPATVSLPDMPPPSKGLTPTAGAPGFQP